MRDNAYKYGRYVNENQETRWATTEEIRKSGTFIDLSADSYPVGGLPLLSDGKTAFVDGEDRHSLLFGATGSKKTRLFCMPLLNILAKAGESFVTTDPKGELYERTSGFAKRQGYKIVVINLRDVGYGDMWNPLAIPYELYRSGRKDEGVAMLNDFVALIADRQMKTTKDVFWPEMASSFALANLLLLMERAKPEEVNLASLARLCALDNEDPLKELSDRMDPNSTAGMNYRAIFTAATVTKQSIYATLYGMVRVFITQKNLTRMLTGNTVDIRTFGKQKTAVYVIVPDEKTTQHFLVTTFIKQVYELLTSEAQRMPGKHLPVRVNFVLDEFCNLPRIPDMPSMISAARSRNMRFFLVAQSLHQLQGRYGEDADTIKGNCENWVFLTSRELSLLNEVSDLCGSRQNEHGHPRKLISVSELQRLDKTKGEALIMHARQYPIITEIADIDEYEMFKGIPPVRMKRFVLPKAPIFSAQALVDDIEEGKQTQPFPPGCVDEEAEREAELLAKEIQEEEEAANAADAQSGSEDTEDGAPVKALPPQDDGSLKNYFDATMRRLGAVCGIPDEDGEKSGDGEKP